MGDGNERTGDEATICRERSERIDGRRNPSDGKGSGSRGEDSLHDPDRHNGDKIHDFVVAIMIRDGFGRPQAWCGIARLGHCAGALFLERMAGRIGPLPAIKASAVFPSNP
jgi:hypothetical protein